jgi:putative membrane protein
VSATETQDAARRTRLANERTYLAWLRTGLAAFAVCIGLGRIVPGVATVTAWPYEVVGAAYGIFGMACLVIAHIRVRAVERAVDRGEFAPLDTRIGLALLTCGVALGAATVALVLFGS